MAVNFTPQASAAKYSNVSDSANKTKMSPVAKGALIGAAADAGVGAGILGVGAHMLNAANIKKGGDNMGIIYWAKKIASGSKGKLALMCAGGLAISALIGAGIGKLVKNHQENKKEVQIAEKLKQPTPEEMAEIVDKNNI